MNDTKIGENEYMPTKLSARTQFHIMRRLTPIIGDVVKAIQDSKGGDKDEMASKVIGPVAESLAKLSDADADYVLFGLLRAIKRKLPNGMGYSPICADGHDAIMYEDINMQHMLQLAWVALRYNMSDFFAALPSDLKDAAQKLSAQ